jgi:uncharacterized membrane protein YhaH (DUF805 family)
MRTRAAPQGRHARDRQEAGMTIDPSADPALGGTQVGFGGAIATCFRKYMVFRGRARRPEYWYWMLFEALLEILALELDAATFHRTWGPFHLTAALGLFLPTLAVTVRRLHDTDTSGWWVVIPLIGAIAIPPIRVMAIPLIGAIAFTLIAAIAAVGWIALLVQTCRRGTEGANRFGPEFARPMDAFPAALEAG